MITAPTNDSIREAAVQLSAGKVVAFPTETVYGLGADAFNASAVAKVFELKGRPATNPLIVHIASVEDLAKVALLPLPLTIEERLWKVSALWPGPLSVVLPAAPQLPAIVRAGLPTVAVRIPSHSAARRLLAEFGGAIAAPSANISNYVSATTAQHVEEAFGPAGIMVLDGGPCRVGMESTIISLDGENPRLLRPGSVSLEQLQLLLGPIDFRISADPEGSPAISPGRLSSHYAPRTPIAFADSVERERLPQRVGLIAFSEQRLHSFDYAAIDTLSSCADYDEVARNLFAAMRRQDRLGLELILVDRCGAAGIGLAIMDRLKRAMGQGASAAIVDQLPRTRSQGELRREVGNG